MAGIHVVVMPYPGRGHINPTMNLCKLLALTKSDILITFVVTEEWLGFIGADPTPPNLRFATIPNVIPPERLKAADIQGFNEAFVTKMEAPFEQLLDRLQPPVDAIIGDLELRWPIAVGRRRNILVATLWTMSATFFSMLYRADISSRVRQLSSNWIDHGVEVDQISGLSSTHKADLRKVFEENDGRVMEIILDCISRVPKADCLLFTSFYEFEPEMMEALKLEFPFPIYPIGPAIPYFEIEKEPRVANDNDGYNYQQWLDSQPADSVLYISLGSFLSVSASQMDEIASGLRDSGIRFLWVARGEAPRLKERCGERGLVVAWCEQLKVLCHSSIGGFWTHCGWNSTLEAVFAGIPMLTFPLFLDQNPNSTHIVEDWKIGCRVQETKVGAETLILKEEISEIVQRFMDLSSPEGKQMRDRAKRLKEICHRATGEGGSSRQNLDEFIRSISKGDTK